MEPRKNNNLQKGFVLFYSCGGFNTPPLGAYEGY